MATIRHKKSLGQHFLEDQTVLEGIVECAGVGPEDTVLEIGPGSGNMTRLLAARAKRLVAVEVDTSLKEILEHELSPYPGAEVIFANFLSMDMTELHRVLGGGSFKVVANLPYYITTSILEQLFMSGLPMESITVLIQKEAADRLVSPPGGKDYGPLTVACARWGQGRITLKVPPGAFVPPPKVDSAVVHITCHGENPYPGLDEAFFRRVVKTAFTQRRKQLKNTLGGLGLPGAMIEQALAEAGIEGSRRPETLSCDEFAALSSALVRKTGKK